MDVPNARDGASDRSSDDDLSALSDGLLEGALRAVFAERAKEPRAGGDPAGRDRDEAEDMEQIRLPPTPGALGSPSAPPRDPAVPARVGRYEIAGPLARGGVGIVLRGRDAELGRDVAIKVLLEAHRDRQDMRRRLIEEAQIGGQLDHPGIVSVHELGLLAGETPYFTMKLVKGRTLSSLFSEREDSARDRQRFLRIFEQVCHAVAYSHARGVIHRDLKPSNVMVGAFGEVQVMDWGLAKVVRGPERASAGDDAEAAEEEVHTIRSQASDSASLAGSVMGTPAYMAPEQARGEIESVDERADVFGLGAILCEILTGNPPYAGKTTAEIVRRARAADIGPAIARLEGSGADAELVALARSCLAPAARDRPPDAGAVAEGVRKYLESLEERARRAVLEAAEARVRAEGERKAHKLTLLLCILVATAVLAGGGFWAWLEIDRQARRVEAEQRLSRAVGEAERLEEEARTAKGGEIARWEAALTAAQAARRLAEGEVSSELRRRTSALCDSTESGLHVAKLVKRLEQVRSISGLRTGIFEEQRSAEGYRRAFHDHFGVALETLEADEARELLVSTGRGEELAAYLVFWAVMEEKAGAESRRPERLIDIGNRSDPHPLRSRLRRAMMEGNAEELVRLAESPELESSSPLTLSLLGFALRREREIAAARRVLKLARRLYPDDFWIACDYGDLLAEEYPPDLEEAQRVCYAAVALRPDFELAYTALGRAVRQAGDLDRSVEVLREGLERVEEPWDLYNSLAVSLEAKGELEEAEALYWKALGSRPRPVFQAAVFSNLGSLYEKRGRIDEARAFMERAAELDGENPHPHNNLGCLLARAGRLDEGIARFREAVRLKPTFAMARKNLGEALLEKGEVDAAIEELQAAVTFDETYAAAHRLLGTAYVETGRVGEAIRAWTASLRLEPEEGYAYRKLLEFFERSEPPPRPAIDALLDEIEAALRRGPHHRLAPVVLATAWIERGDPTSFASSALEAAESVAAATRRRDPAALHLVGRVQSLAGRREAAVLTFEMAARLPGASAELEADLRRARAALRPDLASYASVDAAVRSLEEGIEIDRARERFREFRELATDADRRLRLAYLEGLLVARAGRRAEAAAEIWSVIRRDASHPEPFLAYWDSFGSPDAPAVEKLAAFHARLKDVALPPEGLPRAPFQPVLSVAYAPVDPAGVITLRSSPFRHLDPRVALAASRWQIVAPGGDWMLDPVLDRVRSGGDGELELPRGFLLPGRPYAARVAHRGSDGRVSPFSETFIFETAPSESTLVPVDLDSLFDADVVSEPGDSENDAFDVDGNTLAVDGFDGAREGQAGVRGLPRDRRVGVHRLGDYARANAIQLDAASEKEIRIPLPEARYLALRFLVSGANGDSIIPLRLEFAGGTSERRSIRCDDWFDDGSELGEGVTPVRNGMDRLLGSELEDRDDPALFEVLVPVESDVPLRALVLVPSEAVWAESSTRFHLFAVSGVRRD